MTKINVFFLFLLISFILLFRPAVLKAQDIQKPVLMAGRLLDSLTMRPVADVVVVNKNTNKVSLSAADGYYYIDVRLHDTVVFYLIGYFPKYLIFTTPEQLKKQVQVSFLKPNIEELKEIEVTAKNMHKENKKLPYNQTPATVSSPISFLYERYSKKYKQYRKIEALEKAKQDKQLQQGRFNKEFVMSVTGLDEDEAVEFMRMCRFSNDFIENASDYDFIVAIHKKYRYYAEKR